MCMLIISACRFHFANKSVIYGVRGVSKGSIPRGTLKIRIKKNPFLVSLALRSATYGDLEEGPKDEECIEVEDHVRCIVVLIRRGTLR